MKVRSYEGRVHQILWGGQEKGGATCESCARWGVKIEAFPAITPASFSEPSSLLCLCTLWGDGFPPCLAGLGTERVQKGESLVPKEP